MIDLTTMTLTLAPVDAGIALSVALIGGIAASALFATYAVKRWL